MTAREMTSQRMWSSSKGVSRRIRRSGLCVSACGHGPLSHMQPCCPPKVEQTAEKKTGPENSMRKRQLRISQREGKEFHSLFSQLRVMPIFLTLVLRGQPKSLFGVLHAATGFPPLFALKRTSWVPNVSQFWLRRRPIGTARWRETQETEMTAAL